VLDVAWPPFDPVLAREDSVEIPVQINGKMRGKVTVEADASEDAVVTAAKADENVARHLEGKTVRKVIYVPNRMVNLIVG
jgi:leucyl-tRNA synthetase